MRRRAPMDQWRKRLSDELAAQNREMKEVSLAAGLGPSYVFDALKRGRGGKVAQLQAIARALGKPENWLLVDTNHGVKPLDDQTDRPIYILGEAEPWAWRMMKADGGEAFERRVSPLHPHPKFPIDKQFDLIVRGDSVSRLAREGDYVRCVAIDAADLADAAYVVVEAYREGNLRERSIRRVRFRGDRIELSFDRDGETDPAPLVVRRPEPPEGPRITAVVLYAYRPATPE